MFDQREHEFGTRHLAQNKHKHERSVVMVLRPNPFQRNRSTHILEKSKNGHPPNEFFWRFTVNKSTKTDWVELLQTQL